MRTTTELMDQLHARATRSPDGCLVWSGRRQSDGYASVYWQRRKHQLHRLAYELQVGPIPDGMTLDHTCHSSAPNCAGGPACHHRACFNVDHLEVVTGVENTQRRARKARCGNGHLRDEANTYHYKGRRYCRACNRENARASKARRSA